LPSDFQFQPRIPLTSPDDRIWWARLSNLRGGVANGPNEAFLTCLGSGHALQRVSRAKVQACVLCQSASTPFIPKKVKGFALPDPKIISAKTLNIWLFSTTTTADTTTTVSTTADTTTAASTTTT
jgi:hypothetical protein